MKEKEIRPHKIFNEYLNLAKIDAKNIFKNSQTKKTNCYACKSRSDLLFKKAQF